MTETPPVLAEVTDYPSLLAAFRQRIAQLAVATETLDDIAGLAKGHTSQALKAVPKKRLKAVTALTMMGALGMKFLAVEDAERLAKVQGRLRKRIHSPKPTTGFATMTATKAEPRGPRLYPLSGNSVLAKELSDRVCILTTPAFRVRRARMAAKARWTKLRRRLRDAAETAVMASPGGRVDDGGGPR
jgi:hypothetical protein